MDSTEHAYSIHDDVLRMMAAKRIFLVPTDAPVDIYIEMNNNGKRLTAEERGDMEALYKPGIQASRDRLMRAVKAGVRIGAGSDMYIIVPGQTRGQAV